MYVLIYRIAIWSLWIINLFLFDWELINYYEDCHLRVMTLNNRCWHLCPHQEPRHHRPRPSSSVWELIGSLWCLSSNQFWTQATSILRRGQVTCVLPSDLVTTMWRWRMNSTHSPTSCPCHPTPTCLRHCEVYPWELLEVEVFTMVYCQSWEAVGARPPATPPHRPMRASCRGQPLARVRTMSMGDNLG